MDAKKVQETMLARFSQIFKDNNEYNEKTVIGFLSFAVMTLYSIVDIVTGVMGMPLEIHEFVPTFLSAQVVGKTQTEEYRASFEKKVNIDSLMDYDGPKIPIQLLNIGINEEVFAMYPELKDKRVGLGVTNIVVEYLEETNRFTFTEDKTEIKNRMVKQFQASQSGITENKLDGRGKIKLAEYFVYIEVYDFSVSEDETINMKDGVKNKVVTRLGNQSTIGTTTKKALEDASAKIVTRMVRKGLFKK